MMSQTDSKVLFLHVFNERLIMEDDDTLLNDTIANSSLVIGKLTYTGLFCEI